MPRLPDGSKITIPFGSAGMSLRFEDADPVAQCHVGDCKWHGHGDSVNDAVTAWTSHLTEKHRDEWY